jgi:hypothetical protein
MAAFQVNGQNIGYWIPTYKQFRPNNSQYFLGAIDVANTSYLMDIVPKVASTYDIGTEAVPFKNLRVGKARQKDVHYTDDFLGKVVNTVQDWTLAGTGTPTFTVTADVDGGEGVLATTTALNDTAVASENGIRKWSSGKNAEIEFMVNALSAVIQIEVQLGFYKDATHYCWFNLDCGAAAANWYAQTNNGAAANSVDTGVLGAVGAHTFRIRCVTGHIYFDIDGVNVVDMTTNIPTDKWERYMAVKTTVNLSAMSVKLDRVEAMQDR